jgi:hypothetical protein
MRFVQRLFGSAHVLIVAVFFISAVTLVIFSIGELWGAIRPSGEVSMHQRFVAVLECIGLLTIAVAALELGQTILEEEVKRSTPISAPTRVRRFLSRFIVVVVVALSIECLVAVFQFIHDAPEKLPHAAAVGFAGAALLAAWGLFVRLNVAAEELEPEGMADAKREDGKIAAADGEDEDQDRGQDQDQGRKQGEARPARRNTRAV